MTWPPLIPTGSRLRAATLRPAPASPPGMLRSVSLALSLLTLLAVPSASPATAQPPGDTSAPRGARISQETRVLDTYPFSEPNPVPVLTRDRRLYPYHTFEGYAAVAEPREWTVVKLENDLVEVFVLPEVGGKVWGAVVKATGHEFIYRNEVMKFRNIALRGPWTSGGIEFNFGVIGHAPSTATPVDYVLRENPDGSVSCWVGSTDLPSRTVWRVEIRLPPDEAVFETNVFWYNPTPLEQPYYNWMTAAAFARDDLEMTMAGNAYLHHSGRVDPWPVDQEGRYLPLYPNNAFAGHKSYHVVGELRDFFGGYYHDDDWGFGHWARYEEMPGQKLWLWALSREGGVWEELLTDTDGQYVEFQAGRLFVQYSPGAHVNPITETGFNPLSASRWAQRWFPLQGIGGLTEASAHGALHVTAEGERLALGVNAFRNTEDTLRVWAGPGEATSHAGRARTGLAGDEAASPGTPPMELVAAIPVTLAALEPFRTELAIPPGLHFRIELPALGLEYTSDDRSRRLSRSFVTSPDAWSGVSEAARQVFQARELMKGRRYPEARTLFGAALRREPRNREALLAMAELDYRRGYMDASLGHAKRVLELDAYDGAANFLAGLAYRAMRMRADARDAFGWAARSMAYRSAAYVQLAELMIMEAADTPARYPEALRYARLALDYDRTSVSAWRALAVAGRRTGSDGLAREARNALLALDPLHHFVVAEHYLESRDPTSADAFFSTLGGEYPDQTLLELAIMYANLGLRGDGLAILEAGEAARGTVGGEAARVAPGTSSRDAAAAGGSSPDLVHRAWMAYLANDPSRLRHSGEARGLGPSAPASISPNPGPPYFTFPFRTETLGVLMWAADRDDAWAWRYLLALNLWALDRSPDEAEALFTGLGQVPDHAPFYAARAHFLRETRGTDPEPDLRRAVTMDPDTRVLHVLLAQHLQESGMWPEALAAVEEARVPFPSDFNLQLLHARSLIHLGRPHEAAEILAATLVLPSEHARDSHRLWEQAHTLAALDAMESSHWTQAREHLLAALEWPEHLGQGRPYQPEERLARLLLGRVESNLGRDPAALEAYQAVVAGTPGLSELLAGGEWDRALTPLDLLAMLALNDLARLTRPFDPEEARQIGEKMRRVEDTWWEGEDMAPIFGELNKDLDGRMISRAMALWMDER